MNKIPVSVVYAEKEQQWVFECSVMRGDNALQLVQQSGFMDKIPSLKGKELRSLELAVFAQPISHDHLLVEGDRVEIIRPLTADPKVVRREMAKLGKTIGKQRDEGE